jgi:GAF domain-containing protein
MEYAKEVEAGRVVAIPDIQQAGVPACVVKHLGQLNIKAALIAPILVRGEWWGLLEATHSDSKDWEVEMVELLVDVANLMAIAIDYPRTILPAKSFLDH